MKIWIMYGCTESGDDIAPYAFDYLPTDEELIAVLKRDWPSEFADEEAGEDPADFDVNGDGFGLCAVWIKETDIITKDS